MFHKPLGGERKLNKGLIVTAILSCILGLVLINFIFFSSFNDSSSNSAILSHEQQSYSTAAASSQKNLDNAQDEPTNFANKDKFRGSVHVSDEEISNSAPVQQTNSQTNTNAQYTTNVNSASVVNEIVTNKPSFEASKPSPGLVNVTVVGRELFVNGNKFVIKGVGYQPTFIGRGPGSEGDWASNTAILDRDFRLLKKMGANTIKLWARVTPTLLDKAYEYNLSVIAGYWMNDTVNFADNITRTDILNNFKTYVQTYKDYPALLMWNLGNEQNNYANGKTSAWYSFANEMAAAAKQIEGANYHPSAIVNLEILNINDASIFTTDAQLNAVDIWGVNVYRGISFGSLFTTYAAKSSKPLWFAEYGVDSYSHTLGAENQDAQATWEVAQYNEINNNAVCIGGTLMEYSDEFWKWWGTGNNWSLQEVGGYSAVNVHPDNYADEEYWGIVSVKQNGTGLNVVTPKKAYYSLRDAFRGYNNAPTINLSDMTVNAGSLVNLNLPLTDADGDDLTYTISAPLNSAGKWQTNSSSVGDYTITITASDGSLTSTKIITITVVELWSGCTENWQTRYGSCLINDTKIKYYSDNNSCGTFKDLPADNGTYDSCDYCTPSWIAQNTTCDGTGFTEFYLDSNNCYAITGLNADLAGKSANATYNCSLSNAEAFDFYDPLENLSTITQNHGVVFGNVTFVPGVKGNAVQFDDKTYINYTNLMFKSENGSVSMWIKKNTNDTSGGIWQIGTLGVGRYIGLFYNFGTAAIAEIWGAGNYQAWGHYYLSQDRFTHVVVTWQTDRKTNQTYITNYANGWGKSSWVAYPYPFEHNHTSLELGRTGYYGFGNVTIDELRFFNRTLNDSDVKNILYSETSDHAPVLNDLQNITIAEGDIGQISASATDADGDNITYVYSYPFNSSGAWQTGIGDVRTNYPFSLVVYDGTLSSQTKYAYVTVVRKHRGNCSMSFYDPLENNSTFQNYCAATYGNITFTPAVSGRGTNISGYKAFISYDNANLMSPNGTVSLWFKRETNKTYGGIFGVGRYGDSTRGNMGIAYRDGNLYLQSNAGGPNGWQYENLMGNLTDGKFTHVVLSWSTIGVNNTVIKAYVNGNLTATKTYNTPFSHVNSFLEVGTAGTFTYDYTPGIYDELRFVNRTMNDSEVKSLYNSDAVPILYGDANQDGNFSMADLNHLVDILLLRIPAPTAGTNQFRAMDVNGDGAVNLIDLNWFVDRLLLRVTKFPVE